MFDNSTASSLEAAAKEEMLIINRMFFLPLRSKSAVHINEQSNGYCNEKSQYLSPMTYVDCQEVYFESLSNLLFLPATYRKRAGCTACNFGATSAN